MGKRWSCLVISVWISVILVDVVQYRVIKKTMESIHLFDFRFCLILHMFFHKHTQAYVIQECSVFTAYIMLLITDKCIDQVMNSLSGNQTYLQRPYWSALFTEHWLLLFRCVHNRAAIRLVVQTWVLWSKSSSDKHASRPASKIRLRVVVCDVGI